MWDYWSSAADTVRYHEVSFTAAIVAGGVAGMLAFLLLMIVCRPTRSPLPSDDAGVREAGMSDIELGVLEQIASSVPLGQANAPPYPELAGTGPEAASWGFLGLSARQGRKEAIAVSPNGISDAASNGEATCPLAAAGSGTAPQPALPPRPRFLSPHASPRSTRRTTRLSHSLHEPLAASPRAAAIAHLAHLPPRGAGAATLRPLSCSAETASPSLRGSCPSTASIRMTNLASPRRDALTEELQIGSPVSDDDPVHHMLTDRTLRDSISDQYEALDRRTIRAQLEFVDIAEVDETSPSDTDASPNGSEPRRFKREKRNSLEGRYDALDVLGRIPLSGA